METRYQTLDKKLDELFKLDSFYFGRYENKNSIFFDNFMADAILTEEELDEIDSGVQEFDNEEIIFHENNFYHVETAIDLINDRIETIEETMIDYQEYEEDDAYPNYYSL